MKKAYMKYYDGPSVLAPLRFFFDSLETRNANRRIALKNRSRDYSNLVKNPDLMDLHRRIHRKIREAVSEGDFYDYGEGYFYQSLRQIGISGFRDTEARIAAMRLEHWIRNKTVLEIGCNSGFLSICIAPYAKHVTGFDIMAYLIDIACEVTDYLDVDNTELHASSFEDFQSDRPFDVVLSFANHSTYDGQTKNTLDEYFDKCHRSCADDGLLLFESHPPAYEGDGLDAAVNVIEGRFTILERHVLEYGGFLDRGRTFIVARKR